VNDPDLHEQLDKALGSIEPAPAPIEETMRKGTHIRWRRRTVAVAASLAAAAAVAIVVPIATHTLASPTPATTHYTVTEQQPCPGSPANEIAVGTVNGKSWRILMPKATPNSIGDPGCVWGLGPAFDREFEETLSAPCQPPSGATSADPVVFADGTYFSGPGAVAVGYGGAVAANVSYVTVTLTNGTVLTLHPVTVYGSRYVAFATVSGTIAGVAAYSRQGEIASTVAFTLTGQDIFQSNAWLRPGQRGLPRLTGVIGSVTIDGKAHTAISYQGPWGICAAFNNVGVFTCAPITGPRGLGAMSLGVTGTTSGPPGIALWVVSSSTARVVVNEHGKKAFQVRPVKVGVQKFVMFLVPAGLWEPSVTAYNSAGHVLGSR
jgi:hypothetical protein